MRAAFCTGASAGRARHRLGFVRVRVTVERGEQLPDAPKAPHSRAPPPFLALKVLGCIPPPPLGQAPLTRSRVSLHAAVAARARMRFAQQMRSGVAWTQPRRLERDGA
jgi:hypothetical protein